VVCCGNRLKLWESPKHSTIHDQQSGRWRGSILNEIIGFLNSPNPSSHTMTLGSTQPLTEIFMRVRGGRRKRLTTSPPSVSRLSRKCGTYKPRELTTLWIPWCVTGIELPLYLAMNIWANKILLDLRLS
jgi:hypothetical protein